MLIPNLSLKLAVINQLLVTIQLAAGVRQVFKRGDIILGGLFPIHEAGRNGSECGILKAAQGVQRMQAMLYAIQAINNDPTILPGIQLGAQILDTCSLDSYALEQTLVFIKTVMSSGNGIFCSDGSKPIYQQHSVAAVLGAASSQVSVMVASMLQLFKVPQVSYSSTGSELSEKPRFAYFSRVVPPDNLQATAMAHLVSSLGWTYVHAVAVTGSYGERGIDTFREVAGHLGVCIDGDVHKINRRWSGVQFRWVASDSWGTKQSVISGFESVATGAITISPDLRKVPDFEKYFKKLKPTNTFLHEYWNSINCTNTSHANFGECFHELDINFKQEAYVPSVIDAANAVAMALDRYVQTTCDTKPFNECIVFREGFNGERLQNFYRNYSLRPGTPPLIDANGDGIGKYNIYQLNDMGIYKKVGWWTTGKQIDLNIRQVRRGLKNWGAQLPLSVCSVSCPRGKYRAYQDQSCCWTCIPCDISISIIINETSCIQCSIGFIPNEDLTKCQPIIPTTLRFDSPWVALPAAFSTLGIATTIFVFAVFIRYSSTPVVMASGRELCHCMLVGIILCYLATFLLLSKPNVFVCAASRILIGLSMSAVYAAILTKTNRLARVFLIRSAARPGCIVPWAQVIGSLIWLLLDPPGTTVLFPTRREAVLTCKATASHLLVSLLYNMLLIIACTLYAFKTRKIPENFNETRLIGFTMYSTSILWLSFGPIYFATQNNFKIQVTSLCMCISLSGTVALCCIFAPKVYIILWQPYKNVRTRQSAVRQLVNQQMRFISQIATNAPDNATICTSLAENSSYPRVASTSTLETERISATPLTVQRHALSSTMCKQLIANNSIRLASKAAPTVYSQDLTASVGDDLDAASADDYDTPLITRNESMHSFSFKNASYFDESCIEFLIHQIVTNEHGTLL